MKMIVISLALAGCAGEESVWSVPEAGTEAFDGGLEQVREDPALGPERPLDDGVDAPEVAFEPAAGCDWYPGVPSVASCGGRWTELWEMDAAVNDPACDPWFSLDDDAFPTADAALVGCDDRCVYQPVAAVMVLTCGVRGEYTEYADGGPGQSLPAGSCTPLEWYETVAGRGFYRSYEAFAAANPCP